MSDLPKHDELYVVSDLHMGGRSGFQIFKEGKRLANFIRWVGEQRLGGEVGLVLNGDVIDTLAEDIGGYVAADDALATMERIFADTAFSPVWDALKGFVSERGHSLIVVIGNHDIELALPPVQRAIELRLAGDDDAARGRIMFSATGAGYSAMVGSARVFCIHGNEEDPWNVIDYGAIIDLARSQNAGLRFDPCQWSPNAGTKLVRDVMNEIKRNYAWIDLLKPETKAAVGVLIALDPGQLKKLSHGIPILWERLRGTLKVKGLLSSDETVVMDPVAAQELVLQDLLGPSLLNGLQSARSGSTASIDDMLRAAEENFDKPRARTQRPDETLGWWELAWDRIKGIEPEEALRRALVDWLQGDETYLIDNRDETFKAVISKVGPSVDFIITGHTHLERAIEIDGRRCYFNCGTWIRLLHFSSAVLADKASFRPVYDVLKDGSMEAIDRSDIPLKEPFVLDQTSAVCVRTTVDGVIGELFHVEGESPVTRNVISTFRRP